LAIALLRHIRNDLTNSDRRILTMVGAPVLSRH
jgi:hypothetical protein